MTDEAKALVERLLDFDDNWHEATCKEAANLIETQAREIERLRLANRALRRGLYGLMDSDDADEIATTLEANGAVDWDKYPPTARALKESQQ